MNNRLPVIAREAKQSIGTAHSVTVDCFVASLLAMTEEISTGVIPGRAQREPGISLNNLEVPDRSASRPVRNDAHKRRIP